MNKIFLRAEEQSMDHGSEDLSLNSDTFEQQIHDFRYMEQMVQKSSHELVLRTSIF